MSSRPSNPLHSNWECSIPSVPPLWYKILRARLSFDLQICGNLCIVGSDVSGQATPDVLCWHESVLYSWNGNNHSTRNIPQGDLLGLKVNLFGAEIHQHVVKFHI